MDSGVTAYNAIETAYSTFMGELLRDGYWQDSNYIVGQEAALFSDAVDTLKVMSKPVVDYNVTTANMVDEQGKLYRNASTNCAVHIIDEEMGINAWGYVDKVTYVIDSPHELSFDVSTKEAKFAGKSFSQLLSQIAETSKEFQSKKDVYDRSGIISRAGLIAASSLQGIIDVATNKLSSAMSNWETDLNGNLVFTAQDGKSAMMLTGEGFMVANGIKPDGNWNWRTFGTGEGFTADLINAGTLQAGHIKILGTEQFYWDANNIYIYDTTTPLNQIRIGQYDGTNYGIGFTNDGGATWESAIGFGGAHFGAAEISALEARFSGRARIGTEAQREATTGATAGEIWITTDRNDRTYYYTGTVWVMTSVGNISGASIAYDADAGTVTILSGKKLTIGTGGTLELAGENAVTIGAGGSLSIVGSDVTIDAESTFHMTAGDLETGMGISNKHPDGYVFWAGDIDPLYADFSVTNAGDIVANKILVDNNNIVQVDAAKITTGYINVDRIQVGSLQADRLVANTITADQIAANAITADEILAGAVTAVKIDA